MTEPTYGLHTSHPSTLDLILLNKPHLLDHCFVLPPVADHCPTLANLRLPGQRHCQPVSYSTWNYENMDSTGLHDALSSIDWSPVLNCECVDTASERWSSLFLSTVSDYVPKVLHTSRSKGKSWYSAFLHRLSRVRDRLFQRRKRQPNNSSRRESYCRVRNWYVSELRLAEQEFYRSISDSLRASRSSSHRWWKKIKSVCGFSSLDQIPPLSSGTAIHVSPLEKAEVLNTAFARQCSAPTKTNSPLITPITPAEEFQFTPIDPETVYVALRKLNRWKASGVDGITNHLLKICAKHIDVPLAHVFNLSLRSGRFPATWKQARVQPVFKQKGDRSSPGSYRPIALLCSVSKVFETLVKDQVLSFCLANRVLPDSQFRFLPGRSTVWQLLSVLDDWHAARERGTSVHAAFLDLAKAFDHVDHQIRIKKNWLLLV